MCRPLLASLILLAGVAPGMPSVPPGRPPAGLVREAVSDPRKARPLENWPGARDLARLRSVEGKPTWKVLQVLGHPSAVGRSAGGSEVWHYPWCACCRVWVKDGVCTGTCYTSGY